MPEYISLTKNTNNETVFSPSVISVGWGGFINAETKHLKINGNLNFKVLRTAFNRTSVLGIEREVFNGKESVLLFSVANGIGKGIIIKLRDKFLDKIISYMKFLYLEDKTKQQIVNSINDCCKVASQLCSVGERELLVDSNTAESDFINILVEICLLYGYEATHVDIANFDEEYM